MVAFLWARKILEIVGTEKGPKKISALLALSSLTLTHAWHHKRQQPNSKAPTE